MGRISINDIEKLIEVRNIPQAYKALGEYLQANPNDGRAYYFKGLCEHKAGQQKNALQSLLQAQIHLPADIQTLSILAKTYMALGDISQALNILLGAQKILLQETPSQIMPLNGTTIESHKQIYQDLANIYHHQNQPYQAVQILAGAEQLFPDDTYFTYLRGRLAAQQVPLWHIPMLAHDQRNDAYEKAIKAKVKTGDIVLDIGTGSGLLAMMAIRAGAAHVYACEGNSLMADMARDIVAQNGYSDKITIIGKHSSQIIVGKDMPQKADLLVTEIFDNAVVGEGVLPSMDHAWTQLLKPTAQVIPEQACLYGALISSPHFETYHTLGDVCGFDLSPMNTLSHPLGYKDVNFDFATAHGEKTLSKNFELYEWNFCKHPKMAFSKTISLDIIEDGKANGILMWFDLYLAENIVFSTKTPHPQDHWREVCQLLLKAKDVTKTQSVALKADYEHYFEFSID